MRGDTHKFQTVGPRTAEPCHGEGETFFGLIGNGKHAARQTVLCGPKMQERLRAGAVIFPRKSGQEGNASAIFPQLDWARGGEFAQIGFQLVG